MIYFIIGIIALFFGFIGGLAAMSLLISDDVSRLEEIAKAAEQICDEMAEPVTLAEMTLQQLIQDWREDQK